MKICVQLKGTLHEDLCTIKGHFTERSVYNYRILYMKICVQLKDTLREDLCTIKGQFT